MASSRRQSFFRFDSRLSRRLLRYMVLASLAWGILATATVAYFGYRGGLHYVETRLGDLKSSAPPSFALALKSGDHEHIYTMLEAIERLPEVTYVEIRPGSSGQGEAFLLGDKTLAHDVHLEIPLDPGHPEGPQLSLGVSYSHMQKGLMGYLLISLGVALLGILVIGLVMNYIFHRTVTRHLEEVVDYLQDMEVVTLNHPLSLERPQGKRSDEIDVLVETVNKMRSRLGEAIEETALANRALMVNESSQAKLLSNLPGMVYRCLNNENWDMSFLSEGCETLTGYPAESLIIGGKHSYANIIHPEDREKVWDEVQIAIASKRPFRMDYRIKCADGGVRWVWEQGEAIFDDNGEVLVLEGFISDFTSRRQGEESLRVSEDRFRTLTNLSPTGIFLASPEGKCQYVNECWCEQTGMSLEDALGDGWVRSIHPDDFEVAQKAWEDGAKSGAKWKNEFRIQTSDGEIKWAMSNAEALKDPEGNVTVRISEQAMRVQAEFMSTLIDTIPSPVFYKDNEGRFLGCNEIFAKSVLGLSQEEILGKRLMDLPFELPPEIGKQYHQADLDLIANPGNQQFEMELTCADGVKRLYYYSRSTFQVDKGPADGIIGIMLDLTERKELEEQLMRSQKMEAIGQLAGGIAHDFNNLLQVIRNNIELVLRGSQDPKQVEDDLKDAVTAVDRASSLTRQLLTYSRKQALDARELHLDTHLNEMLSMLRRVIRENIHLELKCQDDLWSVLADPIQFEQVLMNLCINASDAMPDGGELIMNLENHIFEEGETFLNELEAGKRYVRLSVKDSGVGMDEETQRRIFDPFFSTKEVGKGTGLGLSTAMGIIRQHGGAIDVASDKGEGATFEIYFPAGEDENLRVQEEEPKEARGGVETLLLAEDDESVRTLTARTLEGAGYTVLCAPDGAEALELFRQNQSTVDLVLLDMVMPVMGGREAAREMHELKPDLKLLFISGYDPAENGLSKGGGLQLLNKPYAPTQLLGTIRSLLDN